MAPTYSDDESRTVLASWRRALSGRGSEGVILVRRSLRHQPFVRGVAVDGVWSLLLAEAGLAQFDAVRAIVELCTELHLDDLRLHAAGARTPG